MRRRSIQLQSLSALFMMTRCLAITYPVLAVVSNRYPRDLGRLPTCYSPVRHWFLKKASFLDSSVRLACIRHAASVHPEPGSNSPLFVCLFFLRCRFQRLFFLYPDLDRSFWIDVSCLVFKDRACLSASARLYYHSLPLCVNTFFYFFFIFYSASIIFEISVSGSIFITVSVFVQ